jgi:glycine/D-amino acid oxidase-like deaminating enzyme
LGNFAENKNLIFYNGLGSRGFLMAPLISEILYNHLENAIPLSKEIDIKRTINWK